MYNVDLVCDYDSIETYQTKLLNAFEVDTYEKLGDKVFELYVSLEKTQELTELLDKIIKQCVPWATHETAFFVLFSYDYFQYTHLYISEVLSNNKQDSYTKLFHQIGSNET